MNKSAFTSNYILKLNFFSRQFTMSYKCRHWSSSFVDTNFLKSKILDWIFWFVWFFFQFLKFPFNLLFSDLVSFKKFCHFFLLLLALFLFCVFLLRFSSSVQPLLPKRKSANNRLKIFCFLLKSYTQTSVTLPRARIKTTIK